MLISGAAKRTYRQIPAHSGGKILGLSFIGSTTMLRRDRCLVRRPLQPRRPQEKDALAMMSVTRRGIRRRFSYWRSVPLKSAILRGATLRNFYPPERDRRRMEKTQARHDRSVPNSRRKVEMRYCADAIDHVVQRIADVIAVPDTGGDAVHFADFGHHPCISGRYAGSRCGNSVRSCLLPLPRPVRLASSRPVFAVAQR